MDYFFTKPMRVYRLVAALLCLLAGATAARAQALSTIYTLGTVTGSSFVTNALGLSVGQQVLYPANPTSPALTAANFTTGRAIVGVTTGQQLVGLDIRPATGQLYALGYNNSAAAVGTNNAQLYIIGISTTAATAVPVGSAFSLALGTSTPRNYPTYPNLVVGVGFDFNPRADRIRVTGLNRANYVVNPNTGATMQQADLTYNVSNVDPGRTPLDPYIGTVAYTQSTLGGGPTTLYDLDFTPRHGVLSTQSLTNAGELTQLKQVRLTGQNQDGTMFNATIDNATFDLDIFTDGTTKADHAYLLELTTPDSPGASHNSSNLYDFDLSTGIASNKQNILGGSPLTTLFLTNIAAAAVMPDIWTGAQDIRWENPNNWSTNMVPTATDDAIIPPNGTQVVGFVPGVGGQPNTIGSITVSRQPTVSTSQPVRTITLNGETNNPAMLTLANGGTLNVYGNFVNVAGRVLGNGTGTVALVGTALQRIIDTSIPGYTHFQNLSIGANGATVSGTAEVQRVLTLTGNLDLTTATSFTLLSNTGGTATVVPKGGVATGTAIVQRDIESPYLGTGYRHYSSPITGNKLSDLNTSTFTPTYNTAYNTSAAPRSIQPFPTIYGYNQAQYESSPAADGTTDFNKGFYSPAGGDVAWQPGIGYTVNLSGSELEDFRGTLTTGPHTTPPQGRSDRPNAGWQLLGNPYPSILDWNAVASTGLTNLDNAVYVYAATGPYVGTYTSYINGASTNGGSRYIAVAHGFFVRTTAGGGSGYISFQDGQRATSYQPTVFQRSAASTRPQLLLELTDGTHACQAAVYFEQGATANFDSRADAYAMPFMNGLALATPTADAAFDLSINGLPALSGATVRVPLRAAATTAGTYTLQVAELAGLPTGYRALLHDATLGTDTDLSLNSSVQLSLVPSYAPARYSLVFSTNSALATLPASLASQITVFPNPAHGRAALLLPATLRGGQPATVRVLNQLGQTVGTTLLPATGPDTVELPVAGLAAGIYTVQVSTHAGQAAQRLTLE